jgi:PmbA protein
VQKLGARKPETREVPVVWDPTMTLALLNVLGGAASGEALFKRSTFLVDREGEAAASPLVSVADDPTVPARLGSRPFDGEGVTARRNALIDGGVFQQFLFDSYYARRTGRRTTGNAVRGGDAISIGTGNLIWAEGDSAPENIIGDVKDGLYLTDLMGFGVNMTTGDFSRGAAGIWIEDGALAYPVSEINVSGNLRDMLRSVDRVGNDTLWRGGGAAPTIRMSRMTVSGL